MTPLRAIVIMDVWFERQFQSETGRGVIRLARDGKGFEGARRACAITSRGKISPSSTASSSMPAWMCSCVRRGAVRRRRRVALRAATQAGGPLSYDSLSSETVWIYPGRRCPRAQRGGDFATGREPLADSEPTPFTPRPSPTCSLRLLSLAPLSLHTALWIRRPPSSAAVCPRDALEGAFPLAHVHLPPPHRHMPLDPRVTIENLLDQGTRAFHRKDYAAAEAPLMAVRPAGRRPRHAARLLFAQNADAGQTVSRSHPRMTGTCPTGAWLASCWASASS